MPESIDYPGFVRLVDHMGDDAAIVQAARVSYGAGTKTAREDAALIDYLIRNDHTTPLEMVVFKFHVKAPIFVARQWMRHRMASINEVSARYSELDDGAWRPDMGEIRGQGSRNKQVGDGKLSPDKQYSASIEIRRAADTAYLHYRDLLANGVCREQARAVLPVGTYTEWYWRIDLHNLLRFLRLRLDWHAQAEIRAYAAVVLDLITPIVPVAVDAWREHVLHGARLSRGEIVQLLAGELSEKTRNKLMEAVQSDS